MRLHIPGHALRPTSFCRPAVSAWLLLLLLPALLASCRSVRYVPVVSAKADTTVLVRRDTVRLERTVCLRDTVARRDSVYVFESIRQTVDTAGRILRTDRNTARYELRHDSRYTALRDSYACLNREFEALVHAYHQKKAEPYPVERELTASERLRMKAGSLMLIILAIVIPVGAYTVCQTKKHRP